jgi:glycerate-2-kinase
MTRPLTRDAIDIWTSAVHAVDSKMLVQQQITRDADRLTIAGREFSLRSLGRIVVVGTGKAGAGMAAGVEAAIGEDALERLEGWVNVPADCVRELQRIHLHAARPAEVNEPTTEGVAGARKILQLVAGLQDTDVCLVLISGGGSALLPAPVDGVSLEDKQAVTRLLMHGGATINELNCVRKQLSQIKGGGLARAARRGTVISLIISDVIDDPLDVIASGPTVDDPSTAAQALAVLERIVGDQSRIPAAVRDFLTESDRATEQDAPIDARRVVNRVIGNNAVAVAAAESRARELGYSINNSGCGMAGVAAELGRDLADQCISIRAQQNADAAPICILSGGEPIVHLAETDQPRKGGRNQELVLAAIEQLDADDGRDIVIVSGGTDGEDGPTDAAGAWLDCDVLHTMRERQLEPAEFLAINNSYAFFELAGGLLKTGPTHTNVMDVRVALVGGQAKGAAEAD